MEVSKRYRVKVETTSKGLKSYSCTVEMEGASMEKVIEESDKLVAEMDKRYPPPTEEVKK